MDRFCWDADWRIKQARDRKERAEYQQKMRRLAKEFAQTVEVGEEFGVRDMVDAVDGIDSVSTASIIVQKYYEKTHSVKRVAPLYNLPAYVFTDKRFMDLLDDRFLFSRRCILQGGISRDAPPFLCRACIGSTHKKCRGTSPGSWRSLYSRVPISLYHETGV